MKEDLVRDRWWNATDVLKDASVLADAGQYKGAISRSFFSMEQAARAALATKGQEPKTHGGVVQAFNNQLVRSGEIDAKWAESLADGSSARNTADYSAFYRADDDEARKQCTEAAEFLHQTHQYLVRQGLKDLATIPEVGMNTPENKDERFPEGDLEPITPGGDPKAERPARPTTRFRSKETGLRVGPDKSEKGTQER